MSTDYGLDSVKKLEFFEAIRKYPGMYIGSKDSRGLHHLAKEVISNSIDEYLNGPCNQIDVTLFKDGSLQISDNGRGIPIGMKEDSGKTAVELCFTEAHAGAKFLNNTGESGYNSTGGEHGIGTKCMNALSKRVIIVDKRDGKQEYLEFIKGEKVKHKTTKTDAASGLSVRFYPDEEWLETIDFDENILKKMIQEFSYLCKGLTFTFENEKTNEKTEYQSENGLFDYLDYLNAGKDFLTNPFYFEESEGTYKVEVAFGYNTSYSSVAKLYTNKIPQEKGTHLTGFKSAFTLSLNNFAREKGWLKEKEANLSGNDFLEGQILIINFNMIDPVFMGQNKEELSSSEGRTYVQKFTTAALKRLFTQREKDIKKIFDKAIKARKAREAAKKAKDASRNATKKKEKGLKGKMALSDKFVDCKSKDPSQRVLLLVEGNSAAGSALEARNVLTDCIYMLRGKIISPLKQTIDKLLANQEISDIISLIGGGFGQDFDVQKMQFDKIVITADQDSDGMAIELLLTTFFFTYMRPLVEAGKLYRAVTPLYIATLRGKKYYLYTEKELEEWRANHHEKFDLVHCKGLGEVSAEVLKEVCFERRRYKRITISDVEAAEKLLEILEGKDVPPRKQFIYDNAENLGFNFL